MLNTGNLIIANSAAIGYLRTGGIFHHWRACEIIDELEEERRGIYGGALGYIDFRDNMNMCIVIRTIIKKGEDIYLQAGGGIVMDSDPEAEFMETENKAMATFNAIKNMEG